MTKLQRFLRLDPQRRRYLCTAAAHLMVARVRFAIIKIDRLLEQLQTHPPIAAEAAGAAPTGVRLDLVTWAIAAAGRSVPWRSDCLLQAMAATQWLRRHGLQPSFYLGTAMSDDGETRGHAWVELAGTAIAGGAVADEYRALIRPMT